MPAVILIGPPGAGKSSVGRALAQRLNLELRDTDALIEKKVGMGVSEIDRKSTRLNSSHT